MSPFNKILASGQFSDRDEIAYESVALQADDAGQPTPDKASMIELAKVQKKLKFFRTGFYITHVFQALFFVFWLLRGGDASHPLATYRDLKWSGLLGEDWNGLIPNGTQIATESRAALNHTYSY